MLVLPKFCDLNLQSPNISFRRLTWKELGMMIMLTDRFAPSSRFRAACLIVILRGVRTAFKFYSIFTGIFCNTSTASNIESLS